MIEGLAINSGRIVGKLVHVSTLSDIHEISLSEKIVCTENKLLFPHLIQKNPIGIILMCGGVISHIASAYAGMPVLISMVHKKFKSYLQTMLGEIIQISNYSSDLSIISTEIKSDVIFSPIKFFSPLWINISHRKQLHDSLIDNYDGIGIVRIENIIVDKHYAGNYKSMIPVKIKDRHSIFHDFLETPEINEFLLTATIKEIKFLANYVKPKPIRVRLPDFEMQNTNRGTSLLINEKYISFTKKLLTKLLPLKNNNSNLELIFPYVKDIVEYQSLYDLCRLVGWDKKISLMIENKDILESYENLPLENISSFIIGLGDLTSEVFNIIRDDSFYFFNNPLFDILIDCIKKIIVFCESNKITVQIGGLPTSFLNKLENEYNIKPSGWLLRPDQNHLNFLNL